MYNSIVLFLDTPNLSTIMLLECDVKGTVSKLTLQFISHIALVMLRDSASDTAIA